MKPIIIFFIVLLLLLFSSVSNCYADGDSNRIELFEPDELDHVVGIHAGLGIHFFGNSTVNVYNYDSGTFEDVNINWNDVFERTFRPGLHSDVASMVRNCGCFWILVGIHGMLSNKLR